MWNIYTVLHLVLSSIAFTVTDLKFHKIYNKHLGCALLFAAPFLTLANMATGALNYCFYNCLYRASRGAIGFGDVRLAFLIGIYSHRFTEKISSIVAANLISWVCAGIMAVILRIWKRRNLEDRLAFAPFMFLGLIISLPINH